MRIFSEKKFREVEPDFDDGGWVKECDGKPVVNGGVVGTPFVVFDKYLEDWTIEKEENVMFKKEDLKTGMLIERRNGKKALVLKDTDKGDLLNFKDSWDNLNSYNEDLTSKTYKKADIMKVHTTSNNLFFAPNYWHRFDKIVWQRTETKEMTVSELAAEAEQKHGCKIKVIYEVQK